MKVLFVCSGNSKNFEIVPFIKEQGESLRKLGIDVEYYPVIGKGVKGYLKAGRALHKYLRQNKYDVIHAHFIYSAVTAVVGAGKIPVVLSLMGSDAYGTYIGVDKVRLSSRFVTLLTWLIQPFVKAIISKSTNIEQYVYLKHKSYIIPNGINREKFKPELGNSQKRNSLTKRQILFLGNKNDTRKNFQLARKAVKELNLHDVELVNPYPIPHDKVSDYLNIANILVMPSLMEGSPNVIKEAMACNCPIVSTDIGDVGWVFGDTRGCYLSSFEPVNFAHNINEALKFSEEFGRTNGAGRIKELGLDSESIALRIIDVYKAVIN